MASLFKDFKEAQLDIRRNRTVPVGHQQRLELQALFKQAELGDCTEKAPSKDNIIAYQKWVEYNNQKGTSKEEAMEKYIELVSRLLSKGKPKQKQKLPPLNKYGTAGRLNTFVQKKIPIASNNQAKKEVSSSQERLKVTASQPSVLASTKRTKRRVRKTKETTRTEDNSATLSSQLSKESSSPALEDKDNLPELPPIQRPTSARQDENVRLEIFRSRQFSSVSGTSTPFGDKENVEEKYLLYEKLRSFYEKYDPEKIKKGLGRIVEWSLANGEAKLNEHLREKYKADLKSFEDEQTKQLKAQKLADRRKTRQQLALSRRFLETKDNDMRKKMDKLTRFLLVNDPELVSHGMYLMMKFIENKGLGALNTNLKKNYGKSLDAVSDEELNAELKKKYGNDLAMLEKPFFETGSEKAGASKDSNKDILQSTLEDQILNLDREKLKERSRNIRSSGSQQEEKAKPRVSKARTTETSFDERAYMETLPSRKDTAFAEDFERHKDILHSFLEIYEPYRIMEAFQLIGKYMMRYGVTEVNRKLRKKYDVDLNTFQTINISQVEGDMTDDEFNVRLLQFVTRNEKPKNIDKAIHAMTAYKKKQGLAALNTKLFMKYGKTLVDFDQEEEDEELQMEDLHKFDLSDDFKEKLKMFYAKFDPTILGQQGIDRMFKWTEEHGVPALDKQLKRKYNESLSEFIAEYDELKVELKAFYTRYDKRKLEEAQLETVLSWAMVNGRDALNFNLRKKYDSDLNLFVRNSKVSATNSSSLEI